METKMMASEKVIQEAINRLENLISIHDNPTQAALLPYIAGIIDGEGTIRINKIKIKENWNYSYHPMMSCGMTVREVPELLCRILGGSIRLERVANKRWKSIWRWNLTGRIQIYASLKTILPFLIVKKKQAESMISFCEGWKNPKRSHRLWIFDSKQLQWREEMYQEMRKLNAIGAGATTKRVGSREVEAIV